MDAVNILPTPIEGLFEIHTTPVADARGRFTRLFCERELAPIRDNLHFTQINLSETHAAGTVRGMHFQKPPAAEAKLIHCVRGRVFDVAVDLRAGSPTFLHWRGLELSADNGRAVFIPEGFAHGFQALTREVQLLYMHTAAWKPDCEGGVRHDDPRLAIAWPLEVSGVSTRDQGYAVIDDSFAGISS